MQGNVQTHSKHVAILLHYSQSLCTVLQGVHAENVPHLQPENQSREPHTLKLSTVPFRMPAACTLYYSTLQRIHLSCEW